MHRTVETWADLLTFLDRCHPAQLSQKIQIITSNPDGDAIQPLLPAVAIGTVDGLEIEHARSSIDNQRHGDELVLLVDHNPFAEDGTYAYEAAGDGTLQPIKGAEPYGTSLDISDECFVKIIAIQAELAKFIFDAIDDGDLSKAAQITMKSILSIGMEKKDKDAS